MAARQTDLRLYLDVIDPTKVRSSVFFLRNSRLRYSCRSSLSIHASIQPEPAAGSIMIFLKHFDTSKQTLFGVGKTYVPRSSKVGELVPIINEKMRWPPGTPLKLYEVSPILSHAASLANVFKGNQTWHDRAHEAKADLHSE